MIKRAKVISQKPSAAKKGQYITVLNDGLGELKAYTTRKLEPNQEIVISLRQGAVRDPLSVTILPATKEKKWLEENPKPAQESCAVEDSQLGGLSTISEIGKAICTALYREYDVRASVVKTSNLSSPDDGENIPVVDIQIDTLFDYDSDYGDRYNLESEFKKLITEISNQSDLPFGVSMEWGYSREVNHGVFQGYVGTIFKDRPYASMRFEGSNNMYGYYFWERGIVAGEGWEAFLRNRRKMTSTVPIKEKLLKSIIDTLNRTKDFDGILKSIDEGTLEEYIRRNVYKGRIPISYPDWLNPSKEPTTYLASITKASRRSFFSDYLNDWLSEEIRKYASKFSHSETGSTEAYTGSAKSIDYDIAKNLLLDAFDSYSSGYNTIDTNSICIWLNDKMLFARARKLIQNAFECEGYAVNIERNNNITVSGLDDISISLLTLRDAAPNFVITITECF